MEAKHTPGPWFVEGQIYKSSSFYIRGSDKNGNQLAWAKGAVAHIPRSTVMPSEANARLIAAAPELLEALVAVTNVLDAFGNLSDRMMSPGQWRAHKAEDKITAARAALAKVTGSQA